MAGNFQNGILAHLLTAIVTVAGSYFAFKGNEASIAPSQYQVLFEEIKLLRSEVNALQAEVKGRDEEIINLKAQLSVMSMQLDGEFSKSPRATLWAYMDALDAPAWCKEWKAPDFAMAFINTNYESFYKVTKERYIGASDFEVHPVRIAQAFKENDLIAYKRKGFVRFTENIFHNGEDQPYEFWKFYLTLPDGGELICGIQITK